MATTEELTRARLKVLYWKEKKTLTEIADMYGVTPAAVWAKMERWGIPRRNPGPTGKGKLDEKKVREIRKMLEAGDSGAEIAEMFSVTRQAVNLIKQGKTWQHVH